MIFDKFFVKPPKEEQGPNVDSIVDNFRRRAGRFVLVSDITGLRELFTGCTADAQMHNHTDEGRIINMMEAELRKAIYKPREGIQEGWFDDI